MPIQSLGTDDCIDEVIEKYAQTVFRLALAHVKARHDAEDVFQDVFLRYISKPRTFESEAHRKAWLIRVTINRSKSLWLSAWRRKTEPLESAEAAGVFETAEETDLHEYLLSLPQKYRSVIHLFYYEDMTVRQIGQILGARESTVRTWLTRARAMLKDRIEKEESAYQTERSTIRCLRRSNSHTQAGYARQELTDYREEAKRQVQKEGSVFCESKFL